MKKYLTPNEITRNIALLNALLHFYGECGAIKQANEIWSILQECQKCDVVSYGAMMTAFIGSDDYRSALSLYDEMSMKNKQKDEAIFILALNACAKSKNLRKGKQIHSDVQKYLNSRSRKPPSVNLSNALVYFFGECEELEATRKIWENLKQRNACDIVSYGGMMKALLSNGESQETLALYDEMNEKGMEKNDIIYTLAMTACAEESAFQTGVSIISEIKRDPLKRKELKKNGKLASAIVHFLGNRGDIEGMKEFEELENTFVKTALIGGYAKNGLCDKAL